MELKEIRIKNFRNYLGEHIFLLNKKITIIYGDNGFGKSTFFDALEWCLTGSISRFENTDEGLEFENITLVNEQALKQNESECSVELKFENYILKRYFSTVNGVVKYTYVDLEKPIMNGEYVTVQNIHGKEKVDQDLKKIFMPNSSDRAFNIKQPYVLSQDQVTDFVVKDTPKQRYKALANLVGLNAIVNYSDNLRRIIKELNNKMKAPNDTIIRTSGIIESYNPEGEMDFEEILSVANSIPLLLSKDPEEYQEIINNNIQNINSVIMEAKDQLAILEKIQNDKLTNLHMLKEKEMRLEKELYRYEKHQSHLENSISKLKSKLIAFTEVEEKRKKHNQLSALLLNLTDELRIKKEILAKAMIIDLSEMDKKISETSALINMLRYNSSYSAEYNLAISKSLEIPNIIKQEKNNLLIHEKAFRRKEKWISVLLNIIANTTNEDSTIKLTELLGSLHKHLQEVEENNVCPVCSSSKEGELQNVLLHNISLHQQKLLNQSNMTKKAQQLRGRLLAEKNLAEDGLKKARLHIESLQMEQKEFIQKINSIEQESLFDRSKMYLRKEDLNLELERETEYFEELLNTRTILIQAIEIENKIDGIVKEKDEIEYMLGLEKATLFETSRRIGGKREHYLVQVIKTRADLRENYNKIRLDLSLIEQKRLGIDTIPITEKCEEIKNSIFELTNKLDKIKELNQKFVVFNSQEMLKGKVKVAEADQSRAQESVDKISAHINLLNNYIEELNQKIGSEAVDFLNKEQSNVQKLYRYLNPMINSKRLKFNASNEELSILLAEPEGSESSFEANARYVLSSGQLNVLALSIFLSLNESMDSQLEFVAIDDPIQNMDDINQYSVCDVLGDIRKQLIFSTHDLDFLKLFIKKNEYKSEDIQVYILKEPLISSIDSYENIRFDSDTTSEIVLQGAIANGQGKISIKELLYFIKDRLNGSEMFKLYDYLMTGSATALFDWKMIVGFSDSIENLAKVFWSAYEKFIMPLHESGIHEAYLLVSLGLEDEEMKHFSIGDVYKDEQVFLTSFNKSIEDLLTLSNSGTVRSKILELRNSDKWERIY
ncbi:SMC family ATPase [Paenibacillus sp. FSL E2-0202]|uniref:SMC family ATPase n=1 Tax=Paenibacillus sp. FSL E2-0202 TaxID=2954505 RepID=UPI0030ED7DA1